MNMLVAFTRCFYSLPGRILYSCLCNFLVVMTVNRMTRPITLITLISKLSPWTTCYGCGKMVLCLVSRQMPRFVALTMGSCEGDALHNGESTTGVYEPISVMTKALVIRYQRLSAESFLHFGLLVHSLNSCLIWLWTRRLLSVTGYFASTSRTRTAGERGKEALGLPVTNHADGIMSSLCSL